MQILPVVLTAKWVSPSIIAQVQQCGGWIHLYAVTGHGGLNADMRTPGWIKACSRRSGRIHAGAVTCKVRF